MKIHRGPMPLDKSQMMVGRIQQMFQHQGRSYVAPPTRSGAAPTIRGCKTIRSRKAIEQICSDLLGAMLLEVTRLDLTVAHGPDSSRASGDVSHSEGSGSPPDKKNGVAQPAPTKARSSFCWAPWVTGPTAPSDPPSGHRRRLMRREWHFRTHLGIGPR